ncbi:Y-family DNA polymerase (plasmid) [Comamonas aquatica]|nr:Y-family DNA polymerase [Comamonas aquatica]
MYAILDAHSFYASVEEVFRPSLREHPFVVLGSNDGAVVARNEKARQLGVRMGVPWFKLRDMQRQGLLGLSGNMTLYCDMSLRLHSLLSGLAEHTTAYSVDEAMSYLGDMPGDHTARVWKMKERVQQWLGLPIGGGIGKTKTISKLASFVGKSAFRRPGSFPAELAHVCNLGQCDDALLRLCMERTPVGEVWGIGRRYGDELAEAGILTAWQFSKLDPAMVRKRWGVVLERTLRELNGIDCIEITGHANRKQIVVSRSLAKPVEAREELVRYVSMFTANAATKMRLQGSACSVVSVFAMTSPFRQGPRFARSTVVPVGVITDDTRILSEAAVRGVHSIWEDGYELVKSGVMLLDLVPRAQATAQGMLDLHGVEISQNKSHELMLAVDQINERYGRKTVRVGMEETEPVSKAERRTPNYTTKWSETPIVRA